MKKIFCDYCGEEIFDDEDNGIKNKETFVRVRFAIDNTIDEIFEVHTNVCLSKIKQAVKKLFSYSKGGQNA